MATRWEQFLEETIGDEGKTRELQEFFGRCLSDDVSGIGMRKALVLYGPGCNGKSVLIKVLEDLVGRDKVSFIDLGLADSWTLAGLVGKRLNISYEVPFGYGVKDLLDGDAIRIDEPGRDSYVFQPVCHFVFETNNPVMLTPGPGRLLVVPMLEDFSVKRDLRLFAKLRDEIEAIAVWSLAGRVRWQAQGGRAC